MKKILLITGCVLLLATIVWAQEKCDTPSLSVNDEWTYRFEKGLTWKQSVEAVEGDIYIMDFSKFKLGLDKTTMNTIYAIDQRGGKKKINYVRGKVLNFPINVGKTWTNSTGEWIGEVRGGTPRFVEGHKEEFSVTAYEEIEVPAGKFKAFKIEYRQMDAKKGVPSAEGAYWYSPEVKYIIKRTENIDRKNPSFELVSFKLH